MNRRNFVVGLGTVATISGVASVTAASFADSVQASANFQVVVDEELIVRQGEGYDDTQGQWSDSEITDFEAAVDEETPALAYVNELENGDLDSQLALLNDPEVDHVDQFDGIYEVQNAGSTDQEVGITFEFGVDVDGEDITEENVLELFDFTDGTDSITPDPGAPDDGPENTLTVAAGTTEQIDLELNLSTNLAETFADYAGADPFADGGTEQAIDLLDNINVGVDFDAGGT